MFYINLNVSVVTRRLIYIYTYTGDVLQINTLTINPIFNSRYINVKLL